VERRVSASYDLAVASLALFACVPALAQMSDWLPGKSLVDLTGPRRFHVGDDPAWARPDFDDSAWEAVDLTPAKGRIGLTGSAYRPGWTGLGHRGYHGYAWYRLRLHVAQPPTEAVKLIMPMDVDDGYEVYVNGRRLMSFGDISASPPRVYLRNQVVAARIPPGMGQDLTFAIRFWMSDWTGKRYRDSGGLHAAPMFGLASAIDLKSIAEADNTLRISLVSGLKSGLFSLWRSLRSCSIRRTVPGGLRLSGNRLVARLGQQRARRVWRHDVHAGNGHRLETAGLLPGTNDGGRLVIGLD